MRINCLIENINTNDNEIILTGSVTHHLRKVLRIKTNQKLTIFNGKGDCYNVLVEFIQKDKILTSILSHSFEEKPKLVIDLYQAIPKNNRWEIILQKAVELGVTNIYPIISENTENKFNEKKFLRWKQIINSAAEQSECRWVPILHYPKSYMSSLEKITNYDISLIGSLCLNSKKLKDISWNEIKKISLLIGPEGDFSFSEINHAIDNGVVPVSFGSQVLRTETAAIFGLSIIIHELR